MPTLDSLGRIAVISPHLDDAVLSCGQLLAAHPGSTVVTVFAGSPPAAAPLTPWDRRCGFGSGAEAMAQRREEDRRALSLLEARPVWLDFLDAQYGASPAPQQVAAALLQTLRELAPDALLVPIGLFHSDHLLAHEAGERTLDHLAGLPWLAYEDAIYRGLTGLLQQRLMALAQAGACLTPARFRQTGPAAHKARAVLAYASQLRALGAGGHDDAAAPERCWRVERAPERAPC